MNTEKWTLEDGRRAERRVIENINAAGESERIIELHVEDERPLKLQQRVVEKQKPMLYEREIHTVDRVTGTVIEKKVESTEPRVPVLVEHSMSPVSAQSVEEDCDCHVTREEMLETILSAIKVFAQPPAPTEEHGLADEIGARIGLNAMSTTDKVMWGVIVALVGGLAYVVYGM